MPGLILAAIGLLLGQMTGIFKRVPNQKTVRGTIVSVEYKRAASDRGNTYSAVVEYMVNNQVYCAKCGWNSSMFHVGQHMTVAYDAQRPESAIVRPRLSVYLSVFGLVAAGIIVAWLRFTGQV